jgi:hypothetical protein
MNISIRIAVFRSPLKRGAPAPDPCFEGGSQKHGGFGRRDIDNGRGRVCQFPEKQVAIQIIPNTFAVSASREVITMKRTMCLMLSAPGSS